LKIKNTNVWTHSQVTSSKIELLVLRRLSSKQ